MACCQSQWPYYPNLLKCNKKTGSVEPRKMQLRAQNLAKKFCTKRLETWGEHWRSLILRGCKLSRCRYRGTLSCDSRAIKGCIISIILLIIPRQLRVLFVCLFFECTNMFCVGKSISNLFHYDGFSEIFSSTGVQLTWQKFWNCPGHFSPCPGLGQEFCFFSV